MYHSTDYHLKKDVTIVDDISDGGRSFIELAAVLRKRNVGKIYLYVTHGIFSKGLDVLFEAGIDEVFTTNSFGSWLSSRLTTLDLDNIL